MVAHFRDKRHHASSRIEQFARELCYKTAAEVTPSLETFGVSVTPIVVRCVRLSARSLLQLQVAQNGGAGLRHSGIDRLAPWHSRPAAFFDICRLFIRASLLQR